MVTFHESFEGGTPGSNITAANTAFDTVMSAVPPVFTAAWSKDGAQSSAKGADYEGATGLASFGAIVTEPTALSAWFRTSPTSEPNGSGAASGYTILGLRVPNAAYPLAASFDLFGQDATENNLTHPVLMFQVWNVEDSVGDAQSRSQQVAIGLPLGEMSEVKVEIAFDPSTRLATGTVYGTDGTTVLWSGSDTVASETGGVNGLLVGMGNQPPAGTSLVFICDLLVDDIRVGASVEEPPVERWIRRPLRLHPRSDGLGMSGVRRYGTNSRSIQASLRRGGGTYI